MTPRIFALTAMSLALAASSTASADVTERRHEDGADYYGFSDDLLNSDLTGPRGGRIYVRDGHLRAGLLRPRVSFVPAMLKSVERL